MSVDLHMHTTVSDGRLTPRELIEAAAAAGLEAIAVTDHDAIAGAVAARGLAPVGLEVMVGAELTCHVGDREAHILAFGFDPANPALVAMLDRCRHEREQRAARMAEKLEALGHAVSLDDIRRHAGEGTIARPHVAMALIEHGAAIDLDDAFRRFIGRGASAFVEKPRMEPDELFAVVGAAGGVSVLAHPGTFRRDDLIPVLVEAGLEGIEVRHTDHTAAAARHYEKMARTLGLIPTGGSDFHGIPGHAARLGTPEVPYDWYAALVARLTTPG